MSEYVPSFPLLSNEMWKIAPKFNRYIAVSNMGRIAITAIYPSYRRGQLVKQTTGNDGYVYFYISLNRRTYRKSSHRAIASAFFGICPEGKEVNHIDGNKKNNTISNLEYVTRSENHQHAFDMLGRKSPIGEKNGSSKLTTTEVVLIRKLYDSGNYSFSNLANKFSVTKMSISKIVHRKTWRHI